MMPHEFNNIKEKGCDLNRTGDLTAASTVLTSDSSNRKPSVSSLPCSHSAYTFLLFVNIVIPSFLHHLYRRIKLFVHVVARR
ncbi:hypothetical protein MRB53_031807 [Persea americana]|uniref:Uncharacterized protein n=1 Tax=Persea americana TaxID=3435 RepID=A0ACC2KQM7_PERAE|nr:hypothetical protein MRB53_031807 [Persea americana]